MHFPSLIAISPAHLCDAQIPIAALRAGEIGILDLGISQPEKLRRESVEQLIGQSRRDTWGLRCDLLCDLGRLKSFLSFLTGENAVCKEIPLLLIAGGPAGSGYEGFAKKSLKLARQKAKQVLAEVYTPEQAVAAQAIGFDGLVLKGHEAGGRVSSKSSFLFLQHLRNQLQIPFWVQGGMGPQTAAAACLAGAAGVVLGEQLWLARESPLSERERSRYAQLDGSETICLGDERGHFRFFNRVQRPRLQELDRNFATGAPWPQAVHEQLLADPSGTPTDPEATLIPMGQDISMAGRLSAKYRTVGGILKFFRSELVRCIELAPQQGALAAGSPWAQAHDTKYPIAQGPMTRVSDVTPFCRDVALGGGLPFLALALLRGNAVEKLLTEVTQQLGEKSWGAGVLGFVPNDLRKEQLEAILAHPPKFALIAGGRPSQAKELEEAGIPTYLHVPSRGLLETFIRDGARKFVLEGRECGGHVGPQCSFSLWQSAINTLLDSNIKSPSEFHILFAGGIHDDFSAAMVATAAAPLVERGVKIGVLMGTAYLFTHEAVRSGAITEEFQQQALSCANTALVESGVGHATRCAITPFVDDFSARKRELVLGNAKPEEIRAALEIFNVGRLRIASKGVSRKSALTSGSVPTKNLSSDERAVQEARIRREIAAELSQDPAELVSVDLDTQRKLGMYMIGEVAALRDRVISLAELHEQVCQGGVETLNRLAIQSKSTRMAGEATAKGSEPLAIIGMSCMFPDSPNLKAYWQNIVNRFDAVREVPAERWPIDEYFSSDRLARDKVYSKWGAFLSDVVIDPLKYQIPPASLFSIEPIQLLALEVASAALTDAGYDRPDFPRRRTAVIMAAAGSHEHGMRYAMRTMMREYLPKAEGLSADQRAVIYDSLERQLPEWTEDSFPGILTNLIAGRIANRFDLGGSNFTVDAACASSLAALQTAAAQLRSGACDAALVGAADGNSSAFCFMCFSKTHALSPDGRSKSFDESADGIGLGEGLGAIVLKRLSDAERDGDFIYAVVKGIASSSDGRNGSLTAPVPTGQLIALERAYGDAAVSPGSVSYIEAHSTGTTVGDKVECEAMMEILSKSGSPPHSCAVGSVKSMIGHTKTAAGLAGLIKTTLALKHHVLPPTIGVNKPNKVLCDPSSPLYVNSESRPWLSANGHSPRRAGVSSFGFGGTNFHTVLEEYTGDFHDGFRIDLNPRPCEIFAWRRSSRSELEQSLRALLGALADLSACDLAELAAVMYRDESQRGTSTSAGADCRLAIVAKSVADLGQKLETAIQQISTSEKCAPVNGIYFSDGSPLNSDQVCYLFPGQGSQSLNMIRDLVAAHPELHSLFEAADAEVQGILPKPLSSYIYPPHPFDDSEPKLKAAVHETYVAQPAMAVVNLFCSQLLSRYGIEPAMVGGHSFGEYVALAVAGVFSPRDLFRLSALRGQAAHRTGLEGRGAMAAVGAGVDETMKALQEFGIEALPANINAPHQTVIAGSVQAITEAIAKLPSKRISARKLPVTAAFHTPALAEGAKELAEHLRATPFASPKRTVFSNTTADVYPSSVDEMRHLLTRHFTEPVRFHQQILRMYEHGARVFIETGPGSVLTNLTARILEGQPYVGIAVAPNGQHDMLGWGVAVARLWVLGLPVRLEQWFKHRRLPNYGFSEFVSREKTKRTPKTTDWILNSSRAKPVSGIPQRRPALPTLPAKNSQKPDSAEVISGNGIKMQREPVENGTASPAIAKPVARKVPEPVSASISLPNRNTASPSNPTELDSKIISQKDRTPNSRIGTSVMSMPMKVRASHEGNGKSMPTPVSLMSEYNHIMLQWLELQTRQVQANERFLETHERIVATCLANGENLPNLLAARDVQQGRIAEATDIRPLEPESVGGNRQAAPISGFAPRPKVPAARTLTPRIVTPGGQRTGSPSIPLARRSDAGNGNLSSNNGESVLTAAGPTFQAPAAISVSSSDVPADELLIPPPTEEFRQDLLNAVSERTGYPLEMLKEDALLEADLGIDSIKTVEIFGSLTRYHKFMPSADGFDEEILNEFAKLKTLADIVAMYDRGRTGEHLLRRSNSGGGIAAAAEKTSGVALLSEDAVTTAVLPIADELPGRSPLQEALVATAEMPAMTGTSRNSEPAQVPLAAAALATEPTPLSRSEIVAVPAPLEADSLKKKLPSLDIVVILGDAGQSLSTISELSTFEGARVCHMIPGETFRSIDQNHFEVDFSSPESLRSCHQSMCGPAPLRVGAVINLLGLQQPFSNIVLDDALEPLSLASWFLNAVQEFSEDLRASSKEGGGWILNVTSLDGRFGCARRGPLAFSQASTIGMCKTLAREVHGLRVKNLDLDPLLDLERRQRILVDELILDDDLTEIGHDATGRWTVGTKVTNLSGAETGPLPVDSKSVILITGGAGGVTAAVAIELARAAAPILILVGRSPLPQPEDIETSQFQDKASLRQHLIKQISRSGNQIKPAEIEARIKRIVKDREILENITAMRDAGSEVEYHAIDIREKKSFSDLIKQIYQTRGNIDGVIHGAGVIEDKLIRDKTSESFARVFTTKVDSALTLVQELRHESLKFLVFFSSVSARLGAVGQVDYTAANEVLNKLASHLNATWPGRVVAINWGPWHGGMVSEQLLKQYAARNVATIDLSLGARQFIEELRIARKTTPEVLIIAGDFAALEQAAALPESASSLLTSVNNG